MPYPLSLIGLRNDGQQVGVAAQRNNLVRNSGFWYAQRQNPGAATTYSNTSGRAISADGWGITNENASAQYVRTDTIGAPETGLRAQFYGQFGKSTSTGKLVISQVIESVDAADVRGKTVRLTIFAKQINATNPVWRLGLAQLTSAGTVNVMPATFVSAFGISGTDPTLGTNLSYIAPKSGTSEGGTISGNALSCTLSSSWTRFSVCFDVPTNCKNLVVLVFSNAGVSATHGIGISQVSLTEGEVIADWAPLPISDELDRLYRYYQKSFNAGVAPVQNAGVATGEANWMHASGGGTTGRYRVIFSDQMRNGVAPTITTFNPSAANAQVRNLTDGADCSGVTVANNTEGGFTVVYTGNAGSAAGELMGVHWTADAEL